MVDSVFTLVDILLYFFDSKKVTAEKETQVITNLSTNETQTYILEIKDKEIQTDPFEYKTRSKDSFLVIKNRSTNEAQTYIFELMDREIQTDNLESKLRSHDSFLGKAGLANLGNTCYMNSILQCLNKSRNIFAVFSHNEIKHENLINKNPDLLMDFEELMKELSFSDLPEECVEPHAFHKKIGQINEKFSRGTQEDSYLLLCEILNSLDKDLQTKSWIKQNFSFEIKRTIECTECKLSNQYFDCLFGLPLPLFGIEGKISIEKSLNLFFLTKSGIQTCKKCQKKTKHTFKKEISSLPKVSIFQLQRMTPFQTKIEDIIEYPFENLRFEDFLAPQTDGASFDLFAVCNHHGSSFDSGHYTTFAKNFNELRWYSYNDSVTRPFGEREGVLQKTNYILFYEQT